MGLADGEGQKDVSDQIESQDQLEDAKPAGQEEQPEEKDCKVSIFSRLLSRSRQLDYFSNQKY